MRPRPLSPWKMLCAFLIGLLVICGGAEAFQGITYTVRKGDTLSGIAHRYKVSARYIGHINRVNAVRLRPGTKILIPLRKEVARKRIRTVAVETGTDSNRTSRHELYSNGQLKSVKQTSSKLCHIVKKGDTLSSIALKYEVTIAELRKLNGLRTSRIEAGQKLLIRPGVQDTYVVRKGDTLWKLSRRFNTDPEDLMKRNGMKKPFVKVGQKLSVRETPQNYAEPEHAEVKKNDSDDSSDVISGPKEEANDSPSGRLVAFARKLLNIPYKFGGNSILGIDCSAYVKKVYGFLGIDLPRTARDQFNSGEPVARDHLSLGDLVFFGSRASFPTHVGIYIGHDLFIHASSKDRKVTISNLDTPYFLKRFIGAKRLLTRGFTEGLSSVESGGMAEGAH